MEQHGDRLLIVEALLLGFLTVAAIGTDELVGRGAKKAATSKHSQKGTEK